ncbi:MAG: hypothetical protein OXE80_09870 [Gammaproteobacteria bacterium]|nr:hypothetical protein [Gammaproteobacteria bacterium]
MAVEILTTSEIVQKAEHAYAEKFRARCEAECNGQYAVIDITDDSLFVGEFPEIAMKEAVEKSPDGVFHLIRIGSPASVCHVGYLGRHHVDGHSRPIR